MAPNKLLSMQEAVARYIPDGASVGLGLALESAIPFAVGHEIIRQRKRDLTLVGPISDILFDQLIGAGSVRTVIAAWVGNVNTGSGYAFRRAVEEQEPHEVEVRDHSNFTLALALTAASMGAPFIPTCTVLGSELASTNTDLIERINPLNESGEPLLLVRALHPVVAVIHVQRAAPDGAAHLWGNLGVCREAALAAKNVLLTAEEIVDPEVIHSDPNRVLVPPFRVSAVVHAPGGAHPAPVQGYYKRDHAFYDEYAVASRTLSGMANWLDEWVYEQPGRTAYLAHLGGERWKRLKATGTDYAAAVRYGT